MSKNLSITLAIILFLSAFVVSGAIPVFAQTKPDLDLLVFPPTAYLHVIPGKSISHHVILQYTGSQVLQVTPEVHDFSANGSTGVPALGDTTNFQTVTIVNPDMKLGQPFLIHPNTKVDIALTIQPSPTMIEKEYPLALVLKAEPLPDRIGHETGTSAAGAIVSNMIVLVSQSGDNKGSISITNFPMPRIIDSFGQVKIAALAENTGDSATAPKGTITLHDWRGNKLGSWFIFPDVVLAKSTRLVRATLADPTQLKEGDKPKLVGMSYDAPFLVGPYTVTTQVEKADGSSEQHTITVFALPFSIIIAILVGVGLYVGYLQLGRLLSEKKW